MHHRSSEQSRACMSRIDLSGRHLSPEGQAPHYLQLNGSIGDASAYS